MSIPQSVTSLRQARWARMDPVEKWTTLIDCGRTSLNYLWPATSERPTLWSYFLRRSPQKELTTAASSSAVPYAVRLKVVFSLLMWLRCLRDVQDTLARLRLPYAPSERRNGSTEAFVFPTRHAERVIDCFSTVTVIIPAELNETAEQMPAPHTWDPVTSETYEDTEEEATVVVNSDRSQDRSESREARLRRVQERHVRPSEDDDKAAKLPRRKRPNRVLTDSEVRSTLRRNDTAAKHIPPPSPLDPDSAADALYHGNKLRRDGCPLDEHGALSTCPIHIEHNTLQPCRNVTLMALVRAHASILSSLYIQGRTVDFTTNSEIVASYVRAVFPVLIEGGYLAVTTRDKALFPYCGEWCSRHLWVVPKHGFLKSKLKKQMLKRGAELIARDCPAPFVVVPDEETRSVMESAIARIKLMHPSHRVHVSFHVATKDEDVLDVMRHFYCVSVLHSSTRSRALRKFIDSFPSTVRLVAVNSHTNDLMAFYPHAALLPQKIGNAFRYFGVSRSILVRDLTWAWPVAAGGCTSSLPVEDSVAEGSGENAVNALALERSVEHLANPSKKTLLALWCAKVFRL